MPLFKICETFFEYAVWLYSGMSAMALACFIFRVFEDCIQIKKTLSVVEPITALITKSSFEKIFIHSKVTNFRAAID
jgi:hypothetical protein